MLYIWNGKKNIHPAAGSRMDVFNSVPENAEF